LTFKSYNTRYKIAKGDYIWALLIFEAALESTPDCPTDSLDDSNCCIEAFMFEERKETSASLN
jgi:hypothetical protein